MQQTGRSYASAITEVEAAISRLFSYAAWTDKFEGAVHRPPLRGAVLAMPEAIGVIEQSLYYFSRDPAISGALILPILLVALLLQRKSLKTCR